MISFPRRLQDVLPKIITLRPDTVPARGGIAGTRTGKAWQSCIADIAISEVEEHRGTDEQLMKYPVCTNLHKLIATQKLSVPFPASIISQSRGVGCQDHHVMASEDVIGGLAGLGMDQNLSKPISIYSNVLRPWGHPTSNIIQHLAAGLT